MSLSRSLTQEKKDKRENKVGMYSEGLFVSFLRSEICLCFYSEQNEIVRVLGLKIPAKKGDNGHRKVLEGAGGHGVESVWHMCMD